MAAPRRSCRPEGHLERRRGRAEQVGVDQAGEPAPVLGGRPADLDGEDVVEVGAGEGAVALAGLADREAGSRLVGADPPLDRDVPPASGNGTAATGRSPPARTPRSAGPLWAPSPRPQR